MPSKKVCWADKVKVPLPKKPSSKIVFNLKDVDKEPVFIGQIATHIIPYKNCNKRISMYLLENAQFTVELNNYYLTYKN